MCISKPWARLTPDILFLCKTCRSRSVGFLNSIQFSHGTFCQSGTNNLFNWFFTIEQDSWIGFSLLNKMATLPIYGKNTWKSSPEPRKHWGWILVYSIGGTIKVNQVCSDDDPWMTFDLFMALSNFCPSWCGNTGRKMHDICRYAMAVLLRWVNCGLWASCLCCGSRWPLVINTREIWYST